MTVPTPKKALSVNRGDPPEKVRADIDILIGWLREDGAAPDVIFGITTP